MSRAIALLLAMTALGCGAAADDEPSPYEVCRADGADCCANSECGDGHLCDFDYICSVMGNHRVECSGWSGSRTCLARCDEGACADSSLTCVERVQFQGGDYGETVHVCVAEPSPSTNQP